MTVWATAIGICVAAAVFEGLCAGTNPMGKLKALDQPNWSPPNWVCVIIGVAWYAICLTGLVRLLPYFDSLPLPVVLLVALMLVNGAVNLFQFRLERLDVALASFVPYWAILAVVLILTWPLDRLTFALFAVYSVYQVYAAFWGYALYRRNPRAA